MNLTHPPQLIDWLRKLHLNADAQLAAKRWKMAETFCSTVDGENCCDVLRCFLFAEPQANSVQRLTDKLLGIDSEFPATNNTEEVRLTAGIVMLAAKTKNKIFARAAAFGLRAASFPAHRCSPYENVVSQEMADFLREESESLRCATFDPSQDAASFPEANAPPDAAMTTVSVRKLIDLFAQLYGKRIQRLSEESGVLWWFLGAFSDILNKESKDLTSESYALVAANEAADRIQLLPPPPSVHPLLGRALSKCKSFKKKKLTLKDFILASDEKWRSNFLIVHKSANFGDLVPITTSLRKFDDSGDATVLGKALQKACPGVSPDLAISELEASTQMFDEIMFMRTLTALG